MEERQVAAGKIIYAEGDPSECAYVVVEGEVEVTRAAGDAAVPLGRLHAGSIFGEVGIIRDRPRSTTTRAATDVSLLIITREDFDAAFGDQNPLARMLLRMVCQRLSDATQRIYDARRHEAGALESEFREIRLLPGSPAVESQIGCDGVIVESLPFRVGRRAIEGDLPIMGDGQLLLRTTKRYEIAPLNFVIEVRQGRLVIRDLGSTLGTLVNGVRVAQFEENDAIALKAGINEIQLGGLDSPIRFNLVVEVAE